MIKYFLDEKEISIEELQQIDVIEDTITIIKKDNIDRVALEYIDLENDEIHFTISDE